MEPKKKFLSADIVTKELPAGEDKWEMVIEAKVSSPAVDRGNEVVIPSSFREAMVPYMNNPVMMFNHTSSLTIGKVLDYSIVDEGQDAGLWVRGGIAKTNSGKEVADLIRAGVVSKMSFMYMEGDVEEREGVRYVSIGEVYEIGPVSIPMNPDTDVYEAEKQLLKKAHELGLTLKSLTILPDEVGRQAERIIKMEPDDVQKVVDSALTPVQGELKAAKETVNQTKTRIEELAPQVEKIAKIEAALKDAAADKSKTDAELRTLVEKAAGDFGAAVKEIEAIKSKLAVEKRAALFGGVDASAFDMKSLIATEPSVNAERLGGLPELHANVREFQRLNDQLFWTDALLLSSCDNTERQARLRMEPSERMKAFAPKTWNAVQQYAKAMDTSTATEGTEWIPTEFSGQLAELVRVELRVASLFPEWQMANAADTLPVEGADTIATLAAQKTTVVSGFDSTEQTPGTANVSFAAKKARSRIQLSRELNEDSVIAVIPMVQSKAVRGIARAVDKAIINGDTSTTHFDTGVSVGSTDFRRAWKGLRYHYQTSLTTLGVDCGTFSADNIRKVRANMGKYALYPSELAMICSVKTYLSKFLRAIDEVQTLKDYGPKATILTGELGALDAVPIIISEFVADNENASGIYDASTTDRSEVVLVNRNAWMMGNYKPVSIEVVPDAINDVFTVVAFKRCDFQPIFTPSTSDVTVNVGFNVTF